MTTTQRIGNATPGGKYHLAYGNPPTAICRWGLTLTGQTEYRDVAAMPRQALCLRCWPTTGAWALRTGGTT